MQAYIGYLKSHFEDTNIIFIDFMDLATLFTRRHIRRKSIL